MNQRLLEFLVANNFTTSIVPPLKWNWKCIRVAALSVALVLTAGCSGIHASKSVSPLDFILPGLMKNDARDLLEPIPVAPPGELLVLAN